MGRKALLIFLCCLAFSEALDEAEKSKTSSGIPDNISEASSSRLHHNVPIEVYASDSPHAVYSVQAPNFITAPKNMRVIPVNEDSVQQNSGGFLKDSYGNQFLSSPQTFGFKTSFPQQFLQLQKLPAHLTQPLVSAAPTYQFKQATPHFFAPAQFRVSGIQAPSPSPYARYAVPQPIIQKTNIGNLAPSPFLHTNFNSHPVVQQQPSSNNAIFVNAQAHEKYNNKFRNEPKFQRLQDNLRENIPKNIHVANENTNYKHPQPFHAETTSAEQLQFAPANESNITTYVNGKKSVVTLHTKPPLPLLDISLLEPLTFDNPLVPQVQHFLPRINEATYYKLPEYNSDVNNKNLHGFVDQKPKSYEGGLVKDKSKTKNKSPKKKQKKPLSQNENETYPLTPSITVKGTPNVSPEYSYEINSPNYKETYKEQVVSYNKETQSEPVNYSYNKESQSDPVHYSYKKETQSEPKQYTYEKQVQNKPVYYSYVHNSQKPQEEKQIYYENEGRSPKHLVYTFKNDHNIKEQNNQGHESPQVTPGKISDDISVDEGSDKRSSHKINNIEHEQYADAPQSPHHLVPEHREDKYHHRLTQSDGKVAHHDFPKSFAQIINEQANYFQPITPAYNRDENLLPTHKPNVHIQQPQLVRHQNAQNFNYLPNQHIHEKSKRIIIQDETPEGIHSHNEKQTTETVDQEENNEENFEKSYKNAAFGFPAYETNSEEIEKDIYNPETYGFTRDRDINHAPFQQYYEEGDKFPKYTHSNYKDTRDKTKEDYFLDYSINKPESMIDKYKNKVEYYKMYKKHRPEKYYGFDHNENKSEQQNAKYSAVPTYFFNHANEQKPRQQFAKFKISPQIYEFDYTKEGPRDNSAYGSHPHQRFKTKTQFVEPQFQYGFEPSSIPHLLDSELATMASNVNPESENPGSRKNIYKENWYIKKTSTSGGSPSS